jgi:hypothetical protein
MRQGKCNSKERKGNSIQGRERARQCTARKDNAKTAKEFKLTKRRAGKCKVGHACQVRAREGKDMLRQRNAGKRQGKRHEVGQSRLRIGKARQ